jgi:hypothetical protein
MAKYFGKMILLEIQSEARKAVKIARIRGKEGFWSRPVGPTQPPVLRGPACQTRCLRATLNEAPPPPPSPAATVAAHPSSPRATRDPEWRAPRPPLVRQPATRGARAPGPTRLHRRPPVPLVASRTPRGTGTDG